MQMAQVRYFFIKDLCNSFTHYRPRPTSCSASIVMLHRIPETLAFLFLLPEFVPGGDLHLLEQGEDVLEHSNSDYDDDDGALEYDSEEDEGDGEDGKRIGEGRKRGDTVHGRRSRRRRCRICLRRLRVKEGGEDKA